MIFGQCNCGAVKFEIGVESPYIYVCHCSICRRATGSNGIPAVIVNNDQFRWLNETKSITNWSKPDAEWEWSFCKICGSPLPGPNDDSRMYIPAGLLADDVMLKVSDHIWVDSKASWDEIGDDGRQHQKHYIE